MFDFCGIGNACVDIVSFIDDDFLRRWNFQKSICSYLTLEPANRLEAELPSPLYIPGGCGANTAAVVIALGGKSAFLGRVASDSIGKIFLDDMIRTGIHYTGIPDTDPEAGSTRVFTLVTPDSERTFATYYGVQEDLSIADIDEDSVKRSRFMCLDGYALNSPHGGETFLRAAQIAKDAGNSVVLAPNDLSILSKFENDIAALSCLSDIILISEQEARFMTKIDDLPKALDALRGMFPCGAVTVGAQGVHVFDKAGTYLVPAATPPGPVIDTNGAGDHFAGGFLYALARGFDLQRAGRLGNLCAAAIITQTGARPVTDYQPFVAQSA